MAEWLSKAKEQTLIYMGVILYGMFFTLVSLGTAWQTATAGIDWSQCSTDSKQRIVVGCFVTWGTVMMAYISTTTARVQKGQLPIPSKDDTNAWRQSDPKPIIAAGGMPGGKQQPAPEAQGKV